LLFGKIREIDGERRSNSTISKTNRQASLSRFDAQIVGSSAISRNTTVGEVNK